MTLTARLIDIVGSDHVIEGEDRTAYADDVTGKFKGLPLIVVRPANTEQVSAVLRLAHETGTSVIPAGGRTGLTGGTMAPDGILLSLERLNTIEEINTKGRTARVGAGVILQDLRNAAEENGLVFPLTFGAQGSARIGGVMSTNAGGSNVLRYGNTRDLILGVEVVLADGQIMNLMSALHKNNSGYDLRHLVIGAEGTLGIITRAVVKLVPAPRARATAMVAVSSLGDALELLHSIQAASEGAVEAFEYMPGTYVRAAVDMMSHLRQPFDDDHDINIMIELAATAAHMTTPGSDGQVPLVTLLEETLGEMLEDERVLDAVVAQNDAQRTAMWSLREAAGPVMLGPQSVFVDTDIAVPLDLVEAFLTRASARILEIDPGARDMAVAHLGDGNIHYTMYPSKDDPALKDRLMEAVEDISQQLGGSFSAEHGVGYSKLPSMRRRKDPVALAAMRAIKEALDPKGILNPGKLIPPAN